MILIFQIRIERLFGGLSVVSFLLEQPKTVPFKHTSDKSRRPFFLDFLVKATIVQTSVLCCTVLCHRPTTAKFTFSAELVNKKTCVLSYWRRRTDPYLSLLEATGHLEKPAFPEPTPRAASERKRELAGRCALALASEHLFTCNLSPRPTMRWRISSFRAIVR